MAENKFLNSRLCLKYDSYENWANADTTLLAGEIAIAYLTTAEAVSPEASDTQHPVLVKVGPGKFNDLPWMSALAADVYDWAKKENPDWNDFPALPLEIEDTESGSFITDFVYANNKITIKRGNVQWSSITGTSPINDGVLTLKASNGLTATQVTFSANDDDNVTFEVKHGSKPTTGSAHASTAGSGRTYVTKVDVDSYGHIAKVYTATETDQDLSNYKTKQNVVSDPSANGNATSFIASISQNANGEITATKKSIDLSGYALKSEISSAMVFKGTLGTGGTATSLPTAAAGVEGDTYKVITAGTYANIAAKVGDMFVCCKPSGATAYSWILIPSGDEPSGTVTNVATGDGLTGGPITSSGTISHAVPSGASAGSTSPNAAQTPGYGATFNIPVITTDKFGHVTAKSTTTVKMPDAQDLSNYKTKQTVVEDKITDAAHVLGSLTQNANGEIFYSVKKLTAADIGAQPVGSYKTVQTAVSSPSASGKATAFIDTISQDTNGKITVTKKNVDLPTVNNATITINPKNGLELTDSSDGKFTINQSTNETVNIGVANKGISTAKLADAAVGAAQTKAYQAVPPKTADEVTSEEIWVFYCGTAFTLVD